MRFDVIQGNLTLFEQQVSEERWQQDHEAAMGCCALEDVLAHGLMIHDRLNKANETWTQAVDQGQLPFSREIVAQFCHSWNWWLKPTERLLKAIRTFEGSGYTVENAERFRNCAAVVRSTPRDVDEIIKLRGRFTSPGSVVPMETALDALRGRAASRSR